MFSALLGRRDVNQQQVQQREATSLDVSALHKELDAANKAFRVTGKSSAEEAEARYRTLLVGAENILRPDDPQLLCAKANLGVALRLQGRYGEAEEQFQSTLESSEKVCEARFVCQLKINIALSLKAKRGRTEEVYAAFSQAYDEVERLLDASILKPDDPVLLTFKQSYGDFLLQGGDLTGENVWRRVLEAKERIFGEDDHRTLACKQALAERLALVQVNNGNSQNLPVDEAGMRTKVEWHASRVPANRAAGLLLEVLQVREAAADEDPLVVENTQVKLAEILMNEVFPPELEQAENLIRSALERRIDRLGVDDKSVTDLHWILGACLWREARYDESQKEFKTCWEMRQQLLGPDHEETLFAKRYYIRVKKENPLCCAVQ
mmetsp:Transcript_61947/g.144159  ORF Transcript_61947/g.144159 Transcript_61947/m.144159 type:complete len:380 (+) Transcript_61947:153-1292(+)